MITASHLSFRFETSQTKTLNNLNLQYAPGEFGLICGPTGSGKSTFLKALNGLVPHHSSGILSGEVWIDGTQCAGKLPHEVAHLVGYVNQQPEGYFVTDTVIEELAYSLEQLGTPPEHMLARIYKAAQDFGLTNFLNSLMETLSGGQQQLVAIAAALIAGAKVLLLDEPTSALDAENAHQLLQTLKKLCREQQITVLLVEHRIERVLNLVDSITVFKEDGSAVKAEAVDGFDQVLENNRLVPPLVELGQRLGWKPLPLTVQQAQNHWMLQPGRFNTQQPGLNPQQPSHKPQQTSHSPQQSAKPHFAQPETFEGAPASLLVAKDVTVTYGQTVAVNSACLALKANSITAVIGPNGSGKSSLLWALQGEQSHSGTVELHEGPSPKTLAPNERLHKIALVPQNATDLLMFSSIAAELAESDSFAGQPDGTSANLFSQLVGQIDEKRHPRDLSSGQQLSLVLAIQLAKGAQILLLDEPTRGLDYEAKRQLAQQLHALRAEGKAILVASHDIEFVATVANEVFTLSNGSIQTRGLAAQVLPTLGEHAPQVWQITECALIASEVSA